MIQFACKKISREEILKCSFNLDKTGFSVLDLLLKQKKGKTTIQISDKMKLERTTVQKAVMKLLKKRLVSREKKVLPRGGYVYVYQVKNKDEVLKRIREIIYAWYKNVIEDINHW